MLLAYSLSLIISVLTAQPEELAIATKIDNDVSTWIKCENSDYILTFNIDQNNKTLYSLENDRMLSVQNWTLGIVKAKFDRYAYFGKLSNINRGLFNESDVEIDLINGTAYLSLVDIPDEDETSACKVRPKGKVWTPPCGDGLVIYSGISNCEKFERKF